MIPEFKKKKDSFLDEIEKKLNADALSLILFDPNKSKKYLEKIQEYPTKGPTYDVNGLDFDNINFDFKEIKKENLTQDYPDLEEILQEHLHYITDFKKIDQTEAVLNPTEHTQLSAEYAQKIKEMDKSITIEDIKEVVSMLKVGPLINAVMELGQGLGDRKKQVSRQTRKNIQNLIGLYRRTAENSEIAELLSADLQAQAGNSPAYSLMTNSHFNNIFGIPSSGSGSEIFDPEKDHYILNQMLIKGEACTADGFGGKAVNARAFARDSLAGGSVHFQTNGKKGTAYNRLYIAVDTEGSPVLFYDDIESGDITRTTIGSYLKNGLQDVLISSFASSIIIANRLGINKLSFGDVELVDIARNLGFGEKRIFKKDQDNHEQKLGYVGGRSCFNFDAITGPYVWMMREKKFRTINPRLYQTEALIPLVNQAYQVMERVQQQPKSLKNMRKDYEIFFGVFKEVVEQTRDLFSQEQYVKLTNDVAAFCDTYKITPYKIEKTKPKEPEEAKPVHAISGLAV